MLMIISKPQRTDAAKFDSRESYKFGPIVLKNERKSLQSSRATLLVFVKQCQLSTN